VRGLAILALLASTLCLPADAFAEPPPLVEFADPTRCPAALQGATAVQTESTASARSRMGRPMHEALPEGAPAPPEVERAITAVVDAFFPCVATRDPSRLDPFFSPAFLAGHGPMSPDEREDLRPQSVTTKAPPATPYAGPWRIQVLPDGRVAALIWMASGDPHPAPGKTLLWILSDEGDGNWRIDEIIDQILPRDSKFPVYVADLVDPAVPASPVPEEGS
jgi:hypothetical protein